VHDADGPKREKKRDTWGRPRGGLAGLADFFRGLPERLRRPESLLMLMALLASLGAHMPPYMGLGALADYFEHLEQKKEKAKPVEVSFDVTTEPTPATPPPEPQAPEKKRRAEKPKREKPPPEPPAPVPEQPKKPELRVSQLEMPKLPPPDVQRKQSITQKSDDPNVEPPPNAEYLAEENRRVEEETVAKVTDETKNDPEPQAAAPQAPGPEESGDSRENERGREKGGDTKEQMASAARNEPQRTAPASSQAQPAQPAVPKQAPREATPQMPTVVHDPMGTFVLAPARPAQTGQRGRAGSEGARANLKVSWQAFEQTYGAEQLAQDRLPREARRRGAGREKRGTEVRAALEN
jgi:hypothetical protein